MLTAYRLPPWSTKHLRTHRATCSINIVPARGSPLYEKLTKIISKYNKTPFVPHVALLQWIPYNDETKETVWWNVEKGVRELRRSTGRKSLKIQFEGLEYAAEETDPPTPPLVYLRVHPSPTLLSLHRIVRLLMGGTTAEDRFEPRMAVSVGGVGVNGETQDAVEEKTCEEVEREWPEIAGEAFDVGQV
ncbi:hypothetical protein HDU93_004484 [Gonapodya sp. JEL0774]|nr:hypothetical protein HDU93_004484 [Gonapodya sp. JEL0774]